MCSDPAYTRDRRCSSREDLTDVSSAMPRLDFALHPGVVVFSVVTIVALLVSVATTIYVSVRGDRSASESSEDNRVPPFIPERQRTIHHRTAAADEEQPPTLRTPDQS